MSIETYPHQRFLTNCESLAACIDKVTLIDLRPAEDFAVGHLPGARHLDLYGVSLNDTSEAPLEAFLSIFHGLFGARGVRADCPVVIYDHESGERASRAVWLLAVLDHPDVRLLDGGMGAWLRSGRAVVRTDQAAAPVAPDKAPPTAAPFPGGRRLEFLATRFDVVRAIDDDECVIVDVRRSSEHVGTEKRARRVGTVPGAVHVFWRDHLDEHGALRPADAVRALYQSKGITPDKTVITLCQGGYRSASTLIALNALGYARVRNYVGSWGEWGNRDDSRIVLPTSPGQANP